MGEEKRVDGRKIIKEKLRTKNYGKKSEINKEAEKKGIKYGEQMRGREEELGMKKYK